jgi:RNA polymerase sigma factor (sigma-70 family)
MVMSTVMDDTGLIAAAQAGDHAAFDQLATNHTSRLFDAAYRILGDHEAAADATQEALLSAFRNLATFRGGSFSGWLYRIVTNACYDQLRWQQRRPTSSLEAWGAESVDVAGIPDMDGAPEDYVLWQDVEAAVQRGLARLSEEHRAAVLLSSIDELSYREIASLVGAPVGTVKSRISRGRAQLRAHMLADESVV